MSFRVEVTANFAKEAKSLSKKYRSLRSELAALIAKLETDPETGTPIGHNCYKIRLAIKSKGRGKSAGGRVITHVFVSGRIVYLLSIYDKSSRASITDSELKELLGNLA